MTQVRLSTEFDVAQETISAYETGKHFPSIEILIQMRDLFNASIDYILGLGDVRFPIHADALPKDEAQCLAMYRALNPAKKEKVLAYMQGHLD